MTDLQARWLAALRSGQYRQGSVFLRKEDWYCCLGVACDVYDPAGWLRDAPWYAYRLHDEAVTSKLPRALAQRLGLHGAMELILAEWNDSGTSFDAIADRLERYFATHPLREDGTGVD